MIAASSIRILRGNHWGERLQQQLQGFAGSEMAWMEQHTQLLKSDDHSRVGLLRLDNELCYLKFYRAKSVGQRIMFRLGLARGMKSFARAEQLLAKQVVVPAPRSCLLLPRGMMLLTEGIVGGKNLKGLWSENIDQGLQDLLMMKAGSALAQLHRAGYCHGDFKWSNLLWSEEQFYLVDLEAVETVADKAGDSPGGAIGKNQARDLARFVLNAEELAVPTAIFEGFLTSYFAGTGRSDEASIRVIMPILQRLRDRHRAKYGQRGQQLLGQ